MGKLMLAREFCSATVHLQAVFSQAVFSQAVFSKSVFSQLGFPQWGHSRAVCRWAVCWLLVGAGVIAVWSSPISAQSSPPPTQANTPTIEFGGLSYTADHFVFCIDRSCSMGWSTNFPLLKQEINASIDQLPLGSSFSIVAFNETTMSYSSTLALATPIAVFLGQEFVNSLDPEGSTCVTSAVLEAQAIAAPGLAIGSAAVIVITDGATFCGGLLDPASSLDEISSANSAAVPIHTVFVTSGSADSTSFSYLTSLAVQNGGTFQIFGDPPPAILRGDANGDGTVNLPDASRILGVGLGLTDDPICRDAADTNADHAVTPIADAIFLLSYLFLPSVSTLPAPFPQCDVIGGVLGCEVTSCP